MNRRMLIKAGFLAVLAPFVKPAIGLAIFMQSKWSKWAISAFPGGGSVRCRSRKIDDNQFEIEIESFFNPNGKPWSFKTNAVPMKKWELKQ